MQKKISAILLITFFSVLLVAGLILTGCTTYQPRDYSYQPQEYSDEARDYGYQPQEYVDEQQYYSDEAPPFDQELPPDMVVAPSGNTYVYMAPDYPGVYFYQGGWYRWWNGGWYNAPVWRSRWNRVRFSAVPKVIVTIPPTYVRQFPAHYKRISYRDYHSNWKKWDKEHYWNRQEWYRRELRDDVRRERYRHAIETLRQNEKNRKARQHQQRQQEKVQQQQQHQREKERLQEQKVQKQQQRQQEKVRQQQEHQREKERLQEQKVQKQQQKARQQQLKKQEKVQQKEQKEKNKKDKNNNL